MMRALAVLLAVIVIAAIIEEPYRKCRMGWDDISEYPILVDVCKNHDVRAALNKERGM
ncbi:MAG: hypothetical protein ACKO0Z_15135 [Betaproteobacteria bacterium]